MSPLQRTHAKLREMGYQIARAEHWNHFAKCKQDLFGFIDTVAVNERHILFIQSTTGDHHAERVKKVQANPAARLLARHADVEVWSWALRLTRELRKDGLLDRQKQQLLRREQIT